MICWILGCVLFLGCMVRFVTRFPKRTVRDVYPFLNFIDGEILLGTFHSQPETEFKANHSQAEFNEWQYRRIHLAMFLCRKMYGNARVLQGWVRYEIKQDNSPDLRKAFRAFHVACMQSRVASRAVHFRLRLWLLRMNLFPALGAPSFSKMEEHSQTLIKMYTSAELLADALCRMYGEEVHEKMLAVLGTVDSELDEHE
jgi:hypothetical protein